MKFYGELVHKYEVKPKLITYVLDFERIEVIATDIIRMIIEKEIDVLIATDKSSDEVLVHLPTDLFFSLPHEDKQKLINAGFKADDAAANTQAVMQILFNIEADSNNFVTTYVMPENNQVYVYYHCNDPIYTSVKTFSDIVMDIKSSFDMEELVQEINAYYQDNKFDPKTEDAQILIDGNCVYSYKEALANG